MSSVDGGGQEAGKKIQNRDHVVVFIGHTADMMWNSVVAGTSKNVSIIGVTFLDKREMSCLSIVMEHLQTSLQCEKEIQEWIE